MRLIAVVLSGLLLMAQASAAQTPDEVQISVGGFQLSAGGAEKPAGVWRGTGALRLDTSTVGIFSMRGCGAFSVTIPPRTFEDGASVGWRVEVTPTRVADGAVTFRLRWTRTPAINANFGPASDDMTLTLRPGESRQIDAIPLNHAASGVGKPCQTEAASLRVAVEFSPDPDRRLIGVDVWLVEQLANGREQSQLQSVRGLPYRKVPFYFDSIVEGTDRLDMVGHFTAFLERDGIRIDLEHIRLGAHPGQKGYQSARWFRATLTLKPGEIVDVALPRPDEGFDAFVKRNFSLRIRARQIR